MAEVWGRRRGIWKPSHHFFSFSFFFLICLSLSSAFGLCRVSVRLVLIVVIVVVTVLSITLYHDTDFTSHLQSPFFCLDLLANHSLFLRPLRQTRSGPGATGAILFRQWLFQITIPGVIPTPAMFDTLSYWKTFVLSVVSAMECAIEKMYYTSAHRLATVQGFFQCSLINTIKDLWYRRCVIITCLSAARQSSQWHRNLFQILTSS